MLVQFDGFFFKNNGKVYAMAGLPPVKSVSGDIKDAVLTLWHWCFEETADVQVLWGLKVSTSLWELHEDSEILNNTSKKYYAY